MRVVLVVACIGLLAGSGCLQGVLDPEVMPEGWPQSGIRVHPGMQIAFYMGDSVSSCTAGFLFASADNATLFLSVTAHCLHSEAGDVSVGDAAYSDNRGSRIGTVSFDGWADGNEEIDQDLALVALSNRASLREHAHPAVPHWGGPTGLASPETALPGSGLLGYGHSSNRPEATPMTGTLYGTPPKTFVDPLGTGGVAHASMRPHVVSGDSGGPLMLDDGRALGLLHGHYLVGHDGRQIELYTPIAPMLETMRAQGGEMTGLELVTWAMD